MTLTVTSLFGNVYTIEILDYSSTATVIDYWFGENSLHHMLYFQTLIKLK